MSALDADPIAAFYDRHPYPPPIADLEGYGRRLGEGSARRTAHHLIWPARPYGSVRSVLVAGCGTSQAVRHALRQPAVRVVAVDVSATSIEHTRALAARHDVTNLEVHRRRIEDVAGLEERFDHVVCTGVLHHLADPVAGLRQLRDVLAPHGAITLMVYARYGRVGVSMLQEYGRRLGITTSPDDLAELVATLRELPLGHPLGRLLRESRDFADDDALADALCNPRARTYTVTELYGLLGTAGLRFGRWERQAPYMPGCGAISQTPHAARIAERPTAEQHALLELFRGTMTRHTVIAYDADDDECGVLDFTGDVGGWVPVPTSSAIAVEERVPPGAAAALINRAHTDTDLVLFVDRRELEVFRALDGRRTVGELGPDAPALVERLWHHDLVVVDTTGASA